MAKLQQLAAAVLIVLMVMASSPEAARLLRSNDGAGAGNIALPGDDQESNCEKFPTLAGKYGPVLLNALPKGPMPPSAPSKGTNDVNN